MSKATSINSLTSDANISHEIDGVLAEIESSKINESMPPPQMQQQVQMPPQQQQQVHMPRQMETQTPPQMPPQMPQQIPPEIAQQLQNQPPQFYSNFPVASKSNSGIMDFINGLLIQGPEIKWIAIIAGLFVALNLRQTVEFVGKYLPFTINELQNSTILGHLSRGLILGLLFVVVNKFV